MVLLVCIHLCQRQYEISKLCIHRPARIIRRFYLVKRFIRCSCDLILIIVFIFGDCYPKSSRLYILRNDHAVLSYAKHFPSILRPLIFVQLCGQRLCDLVKRILIFRLGVILRPWPGNNPDPNAIDCFPGIPIRNINKCPNIIFSLARQEPFEKKVGDLHGQIAILCLSDNSDGLPERLLERKMNLCRTGNIKPLDFQFLIVIVLVQHA